jgi:aspartyl-tRNA(Asn)/glutamyl-tRNA(Gln) amidotransferase subunit C
MKREDIEHLAGLARIKLTEKEMESLPKELSSIISYVSVVSDIAAGDVDAEPQVGVRFNVFKEDKITNEPDEFTKDIMAEMPSKEGRYLLVKKILQIDE